MGWWRNKSVEEPTRLDRAAYDKLALEINKIERKP
jgi:hypothetical protein